MANTKPNATQVTYDGGTVQDVLDYAKAMANYTALRAYTGRAKVVRITDSRFAGLFILDAVDTTTADNGGTVIVDGSGRLWKRQVQSVILASWFNVVPESPDVSDALAAALAYHRVAKLPLVIGDGWFQHSKPIVIRSGDVMYGQGEGRTLFQKSTNNTSGLLHLLVSIGRKLMPQDKGMLLM